MSYKLEYIAETLRTARKKKGLSQRALSSKVGLPQSHISKIENGAIDLKTSNLIEISRVLDLELMFVPRILVTTVRGLVRRPAASSESEEEVPAAPAYRLHKE